MTKNQSKTQNHHCDVSSKVFHRCRDPTFMICVNAGSHNDVVW